MNAKQRLGLGFLAGGALWMAYKFSSAIQRGPGGVPQESGGLLQEIFYFLPGLTLVIGVLLLVAGGRKNTSPNRRWVRIVKVLVGGWVAAGGAFIIIELAALALFGSEGVKRLYDYYLAIILVLASVMCLTLMRRLK